MVQEYASEIVKLVHEEAMAAAADLAAKKAANMGAALEAERLLHFSQHDISEEQPGGGTSAELADAGSPTNSELNAACEQAERQVASQREPDVVRLAFTACHA